MNEITTELMTAAAAAFERNDDTVDLNPVTIGDKVVGYEASIFGDNDRRIVGAGRGMIEAYVRLAERLYDLSVKA